MPTVLRISGYRFFFFSLEGSEPPHIHIERNDLYAKFWIDPVALARNRGFRSHELTRIRRLVEKNKILIEEKWNEHFYHKD